MLRRSIKTAALCLMLTGAVRAGDLPQTFTLGNYIPDGGWLYVHGVHGEHMQWLQDEWNEVFDMLEKSKIHKDVMSLAMSKMEAEQKVEAQAMIDKVTTLIQGVDWAKLAGREFAFHERSGMPIGAEYAALLRGTEGSGESNFQGLHNILKELASLSPEVKLEETNIGDMQVLKLGAANAEGPAAMVSLALFRKGDIIGATMGDSLFKDVIGLLRGDSTVTPVVRGERFRAAIKKVDTPTDAVMFFDAHSLVSGIQTIAGMAMQGKAPDSAEAKMLGAIFSTIDVFDYVVSSSSMQGRQHVTHEIAKIREGRQDSPLMKLVVNRKPFEKFDKYIPADATSFSLSPLVDLEMTYDFILDFVATNVPEGEQTVTKIKTKLSEAGFDPKEQIFSWLSGEMITVSMPPAVVTGMSQADSVTMIRVKDAELAAKKVNAAIDFANAFMQQQGQQLMIQPAQVGVDGFREVTHPMMAMFMRPVVGVHDGFLVIGTSSGAIKKCFDVAAGKAPSIATNDRFKKEGLAPDGKFRSASFTDLSKLGEELGGALAMMGMFGGMATSSLPPEEAAGVQKLMTIVMKLGPVLNELDFFSSQAAMTTYDGKLTMTTTKVMTYKSDKESAPK